MSNWSCVTQRLTNEKAIQLGRYASYWYYHTPRRMLHSLSYYKFAAKMIGTKKRVLDVGCNEGLGSWLLAKECGFCEGIDFDEEAIARARSNFQDPSIHFSVGDVLAQEKQDRYDAIVNFDVIEHIYPENGSTFLQKLSDQLKEEGVFIMGTPSEISQNFASAISKKGHVNIYSYERLEKEMKEFFHFVFIFSANDEVVHTGYPALAHYFIAIGCGKRR